MTCTNQETSHECHTLDTEARSDTFGGLLRKHTPQRVLPASDEGGLLWRLVPARYVRFNLDVNF